MARASAVSVAAVAAATLAIYPLKHIAPVVSLSVVYLPAVLLASTYWGLALGVFTSAAERGRVQLLPSAAGRQVHDRRQPQLGRAGGVHDRRAASPGRSPSSRAREQSRLSGARRRPTSPPALARELLLGEDTGRALATTARRVAEALGLRSAAIEQGVATGDERRAALALRDADGRQIATLLVPGDLPAAADEQLRTQVVPTLEALVAIAQRRDAMQADAVETAALRRSDDIKTALLRAVSHDLRTPLTSVVAAGHALGTSSLTEQERRELSAAVVEEGTRLAGMVDNLLGAVAAAGRSRRAALGLGLDRGARDRRRRGAAEAARSRCA